MFCANLVAQKAFGLARSDNLKIPGFPKFEDTIKELKSQAVTQLPQYDVCVGLADGVLVVKEAVRQMWLAKADFSAEATQLFQQHDAEFNPKHIRRGAADAEQGGPQEVEEKQLTAEGVLCKGEFEKQHEDRRLA